MWTVSLPVALDGLKSLFLNGPCGQPWITICPAHEDLGEAIGLGTTVWCNVRGEVCAATATAPAAMGPVLLVCQQPALLWQLQPAGRQQQGSGLEEPEDKVEDALFFF